MTVKQYSFTLYNIGLLLLAASLPLWMLLMGWSQLIIVLAWLMGGDLKSKLTKAFTNPVVLILTGVFFLHVVGLLFTSDFDYAWRDIRIKLPLLILPVVISTMSPLSGKQFNNVLKTLICATVVSTLCSIAVLINLIPKHVDNVRDISLFISHIRFALIICVAIVSSVYLFIKSEDRNMRYIYIPLIVWFIIFLVILESLTGLVILSVLFMVWCMVLLWKSRSPILKTLSLISLAAIFISGFLLIRFLMVDSIKEIKLTPEMLKTATALGHPYENYTDRQDHENGNLVWINICEKELDSTWNSRSRMNYRGKDLRGQEIKYTLIRYLTSKNYLKDAGGISQLTAADVAAIEQGIPNMNYTHKSDIRARLTQLAWEYRNYYYSGNPSGHSAMQRLEFWKTALYIIKKNPFGVGTGDVQQAFNNAYSARQSKLLPAFRFHSHNEYLTMTVAFGMLGGIYFIFSLFFPYIYMGKKSDFLYSAFLIILLFSMLTEDTPETQAGATFMAFLNSFFLFNGDHRASKS